MTANILLAIAGVVLSLIFSYVPGIADKYNKLDGTKKRLVMLGLLVVVTGAVFGLSCADIFFKVTCDKPGALGLIEAFIYAMIANQSANALSPKVGAKNPLAGANDLPFA